MAALQYPAQPVPVGEILIVIHDFQSRSPDELTLARGDRVELIERDDEFGDGWYLGRHLHNGETGLFPQVYTKPAPKGFVSQAPQIRPTPPLATNKRIDDSQSNALQRPPSDSAANLSSPHQFNDVPHPLTTDSSAPITGSPPLPLQTSNATNGGANVRSTVLSATPRSFSMVMSGGQDSPVMNETLSVIDEHITDMSTPRHSVLAQPRRGTNDSGSEYSSHIDHRLSYINGNETDNEDSNLHNEQEVLAWSPEQVAEYLEDVGVEKRHCDVFKEQEISGEVLLEMDQASVFMKEFELGPIGRRLKTWQKIKALQQEVRGITTPRRGTSVSDQSLAGEDISVGNEFSRDRTTSMGAVLPRIPSLMERPNSRPHSRAVSRSNTLTQSGSRLDNSSLASIPASASSPSTTGSPSSPAPIAPFNPHKGSDSPRPSAASIRDMMHARRHSSMDSTKAPPPIATASPQGRPGHRKQPSFDRNWSMNQDYQMPLLNRSPSAQHSHTLSSDGTQFDSTARELGMTVVSPTELDRGYFSGGELDNRKNRNVLRKNSSPTHSRTSSYTAHARRTSGTHAKHTRGVSTSSTRDSVAPMMSPAARVYYSSTHKASPRAASGPDFIRPLGGSSNQTLSPTVTKLEYGHSPSIDAIATSPQPESESSSLHVVPSKTRSGGLRAISDAVTGGEKALVSLPIEQLSQASKESPMQSPIRTGSSTPSATSQSFELVEKPDVSKTTVGGSGGVTPTSATSRRPKTKKATSAYTRGLEKKTPQEQMQGCDYSGWMKKKSSNLMTTWKPRLFVLRGRRLSYYYSENDSEEKGLIDISSHRVLPAGDEFLTGLHATLTGAAGSPTTPQGSQTPTIAGSNANAVVPGTENEPSGMFIFKLVPPRSGLSKAVNFTKPTVHYFAVDNLHQGRLWMAALMKATIDRDETKQVVTTYQQKTISLAKAKAMRQRPPALMPTPDEMAASSGADGADEKEPDQSGLAIRGLANDSKEDSGLEKSPPPPSYSEGSTEATSQEHKASTMNP